jgi:hypothetical protein
MLWLFSGALNIPTMLHLRARFDVDACARDFEISSSLAQGQAANTQRVAAREVLAYGHERISRTQLIGLVLIVVGVTFGRAELARAEMSDLRSSDLLKQYAEGGSETGQHVAIGKAPGARDGFHSVGHNEQAVPGGE